MLGRWSFSGTGYFLFGVMIPVVQENAFVIRGSCGVVDDQPGVAIVKYAVGGPVHAGDHHFFVVEHESLVVNFILNFHVVKIHTGGLQGLESALENLKLTEDNSYVFACVDL